jgi:hypothetical protein
MKRNRVLRAVFPNAGIRAAYSRRLCAFVGEMSRSYEHWLRAQYRAAPPRMALDEPPSRELERELRRLGIYWQGRIDALAPKLARWFTQAVGTRSDLALRKMLRDSGMSVKFTMTPEMRDVIGATVAENVGLIKSIPQQYHTEVEGLVMRSVTAGRDLSGLTRELRKRYGVTDRRARFIALDQANKATATLRRVRETGLGLEDGIWLHSHAGREPRPTHLANHGKRFSISEGWFDPDPKVRERIMPGQLPRCRCSWRVVVPGFS